MKRFSFPLDRVLDWKTVVAQREQNTLETLNQEHANMTASLLQLQQRLEQASEFAESSESGQDLALSAQYRAALLSSRKSAETARSECADRIASQTSTLRKAETERRLVSKLRDHSFSRWQAATTREMDETAADLFLGNRNRR